MRKILLFVLSVLLLVPALARAANAQAQEYDELGMSLYRQGLYAKAITYFQNAVQADPTDWEGYENLGNAYFKINDNADALSSYQKSLQLNPNNTTLENIVQSMQANGAPAAADNSGAANSPASNTESNSYSNTPANTQPPAVNPPPPGAAPPTTPQSSVDSEQPIENGQSNPPQAGAPYQPGTSTIVVRHRHRLYVEQVPTYNDNLAPIDHAKFWGKFEGGYSYTSQGDLMNSAAAINNENASGTLAANQFGLTNGNATMSTNAYNLGAEVGFLINPNMGIGIGVRYIQSTSYIFNGVNSAPATVGSNPNDFENATFSPYVVPITLDYYLFLPDHDGRFFISVGAGYYAGDVNVSENYNFDNFEGSTGNVGSPFGDLTAGTVGFQVSIGREFAINRQFGLEIFARGRYAKITNFQGVLSDGNSWELEKFSDGSVDIGSPSNIGQNGTTAATVDFTGFDVGMALSWFSL
jgi:hypothetical protein